jgi:glutamine amidotransferase
MLDVIDYGGGNTGSLTRSLDRLFVPWRLVGSGRELGATDNPMVLPGVGAFGAVMEGLRKRALEAPLREALASGRPYLGICVGLQILFEKSAETPGVRGLGVLDGEVLRFTAGKVPQIGWNRLVAAQGSTWEEGYAYFVNSYVARPAEKGVVLFSADYHGTFCAALRKKNMTAFQFHPERSGPYGQALLGRWLDAM